MADDDNGLRYDAFLSYSHVDTDVAEAMQKGLHHVGRRMGQLRALRIYRDATDLAANPGFWPKLEEALDESRFFVALLSPDSASSEWANREISTWLSTRGPDNVLIVLAKGTISWDRQGQRFDPDRSTAVPEALSAPGVFQD